uniref:Uncharacterized protein n=1 Tax=Knipowitschia caucasica TaxID=637954 RepID=A0AAV2JHJ9_KNICA
MKASMTLLLTSPPSPPKNNFFPLELILQKLIKPLRCAASLLCPHKGKVERHGGFLEITNIVCQMTVGSTTTLVSGVEARGVRGRGAEGAAYCCCGAGGRSTIFQKGLWEVSSSATSAASWSVESQTRSPQLECQSVPVELQHEPPAKREPSREERSVRLGHRASAEQCKRSSTPHN